MAGLGRRTFAAGEVLTASNVMGYLQDQAVMNFAGTAARGAAIGTAVAEGMVSYLADSNLVQVYDGSAWKSITKLSNSILQIVNAQTQTSTSLTTSTSTDITGITATITPTSTSSKILIILNVPVRSLGSGSNNFANGSVLKNGSYLYTLFAQTGVLAVSDVRSNITSVYLDSPSSTSALTYKLQGNSTYATSVEFMPNSTTGSITLLELAG